jgi:hypothetical protein
MDTIVYLTDLLDMCNEMLVVAKAHAKFTLDNAITTTMASAVKLHKYNRENNRAACKFLLNSLDKSLAEHVSKHLEPKDGFALSWIQMTLLIQSTSIKYFNSIKAVLQECKIFTYSGQNDQSLATGFHRDAKELLATSLYKHSLTLIMLKAFLKAGGTGDGTNLYSLCSVKQKLDHNLVHIRHMSKIDQDRHII